MSFGRYTGYPIRRNKTVVVAFLSPLEISCLSLLIFQPPLITIGAPRLFLLVAYGKGTPRHSLSPIGLGTFAINPIHFPISRGNGLLKYLLHGLTKKTTSPSIWPGGMSWCTANLVVLPVGFPILHFYSFICLCWSICLYLRCLLCFYILSLCFS